MRSNINTQNQRQIGNQSERGNGAQMVSALRNLLSLSIERLCRFVWSTIRSIAHAVYALDWPTASRANPEGIAGFVTKHLWMFVEAVAHVPSLGTDRARRRGLIAS